jgi:hypothetical protein
MNKLIVPKSLLEVRKWKQQVSAMIDKHGLNETLRHGRESFERELAKVRAKKKRLAKVH